MKNKKKSRKADLNCLLEPLQYLVNHQLAQQKLVVYLDKILYYLTVLHKDNHHFLVMQINLLITKIKIQRFQNSVFHLGKMDKKKVKKQINFLCFLIVQAVLKHLFSIKIIQFSLVLDNRTSLSSIKIKMMMIVKKMKMKMMEKKEVKVHQHLQTIMTIKINWI